jgi:hypothetical protein
VAPHWRNGAIGNARWAGVKVRDILEAAGMPVDDIALRRATPGGKIVNFIALDTDETGLWKVPRTSLHSNMLLGIPYAGVIPIEKAIDPFGDAILAYEMNGWHFIFGLYSSFVYRRDLASRSRLSAPFACPWSCWMPQREVGLDHYCL